MNSSYPFKIALIAAMAEDNAIGRNGQMPWPHLSKDLKHFNSKTKGKVVIMGRKTYDSLPNAYRPLPNRTNIIITRQKDWREDGTFVAKSVEDALEMAKLHILSKKGMDDEVMIIGGGEIYKETIDFADTLYVSSIAAIFPDCDTFFPEFSGKFRLLETEENYPAEGKLPAFTTQKWIKLES